MHKYIPDTMNSYSKDGRTVSPKASSDTVLDMKAVNSRYRSELRGMLYDPIALDGKGYGFEARNKFFKNLLGNGMDLDAMDTMRGREAGVPGYIEYIPYLGGQKVLDWNDLNGLFGTAELNLLKNIYRHPANIDLKVGAMLEKKSFRYAGIVESGIYAKQFQNIRRGDRFFYLNKQYTEGNFSTVRRLCESCDSDQLFVFVFVFSF